MPHSNFKMRYHPLNSEVVKCACDETFVFESDKDQNMKIRMHNKVCSRPVKGYKQVMVPKKAMTPKVQQHNEIERLRKVLDRYYHFWM